MKIKDNKIVLSEKEIRKQVCGMLKMFSVKWWYNLQGLGAYKGISDVEGVHKGRHFYIEFKAPKGKLNNNQQAFRAMVEAEGEKFFEIRGYDQFMKEWTEWNRFNNP